MYINLTLANYISKRTSKKISTITNSGEATIALLICNVRIAKKTNLITKLHEIMKLHSGGEEINHDTSVNFKSAV